LSPRGEDGIIGQIAGRSKRRDPTMPHPTYRLSDFDFALPTELIAQRPAPERSASRLLHVDGAQLEDLRFDGLPDLLVRGDVLVFNDTRVVVAACGPQADWRQGRTHARAHRRP
jgi:hypothetical protein